MKLGDKYKFNKEIIKDYLENSGIKENREFRGTHSPRYRYIETKERTGVLVGRKQIDLNGSHGCDWEYGKMLTVYLMKEQLNGCSTAMVLKEWLEPIKNETLFTIPQAIKRLAKEINDES